MRLISKLTVVALAATFSCSALAASKKLDDVGITVGSLGNPFYVSAVAGIRSAVADIAGPSTSVDAVSSDYDLNKQFSQVENFIARGAAIVMIVPVDPKASVPAVKRAHASGVTVGAFDTAVPGADVTVMTDNVAAGREACAYMAKQLHDKGNVVIVNAYQVSAVVDRVKGCEQELKKHPDIHLLSDDQNSKGSRDGGLNVMQGLLTRYDQVDAVFAVNDPAAIGASLAARQLGRTDLFVVSVDGSPDVAQMLKSKNSLVRATVAQDPFEIGRKAFELAYKKYQGKSIAQTTLKIKPKLITSENVNSYRGWVVNK